MSADEDTARTTTTLGRAQVSCGRLGLGSSFGIGGRDLDYAFERGVRYFYWGSIRRPGFGEGVRGLGRRHREQMVVVVQSYSRAASLMRPSLESALRRLGIEYVDFLLLGWWNQLPPPRILEAARKLRDAGLARHLMISCHNRLAFPDHARQPDLDAIMVRYNAAHPGAEEEVFPHLGPRPPGVVAYTATRWGNLIDPALTPPDERTPGADDCYRFCLSHPAVDLCLAGPKDRAELEVALRALERGPMDEEERAWMKRVGAAVKRHARPQSGAVGIIDRIMGAHTP